MPLATLRQVLDEAAKGGYGVGAFNANNMEQVQGIVTAAQEAQSPVIIQVSRGALSYAGKNYMRHLIIAAAETAPEIPIVLHLDHGDKPETCFDAIELGFTSVMMDGSLLADGKTPSDYDYNVEVTREVVEAAHAKGVSVEGELGTLACFKAAREAQKQVSLERLTQFGSAGHAGDYEVLSLAEMAEGYEASPVSA